MSTHAGRMGPITSMPGRWGPETNALPRMLCCDDHPHGVAGKLARVMETYLGADLSADQASLRPAPQQPVVSAVQTSTRSFARRAEISSFVSRLHGVANG